MFLAVLEPLAVDWDISNKTTESHPQNVSIIIMTTSERSAVNEYGGATVNLQTV
jgi:hypothetical protein